MTPTQTHDQTPDSEISVDVVSTVIHVRELDRSLKFYSDVFSCRIAVREADMALLLTLKGFEIYLIQKDESHIHRTDALGVRHLLWATDNQSDVQRITERLRAYDSAVFTHIVEGMTVLEGADPDGLRVMVAYPTPRQLPRRLIAERLRDQTLEVCVGREPLEADELNQWNQRLVSTRAQSRLPNTVRAAHISSRPR